MADLISIVIPIYNSEAFLEDCLDSIIAQNYDNWEAILINDGSKDKSGEICDSYAEKDMRFKVIHQNNQGVSAARNRGLSEIKGDYVCFIDSDDYVKENYLSHLLFLVKTYNIPLGVCSFGKMGKDTKNPKVRILKGKSAIVSLFDTKNGIEGYIGAKIFKADVIKENNISFLVSQHFGEDLLFIFKYLMFCGEFCSVALSDETLYCYILRESSALGKWSYEKAYDPKWAEILKVYDMILESIEDKSLIRLISLNKVMQSVSLVRAMLRCGYEDTEYINNYLNFIRKNLLRYIFSNYFSLRKRIGAVLISLFPFIFKR